MRKSLLAAAAAIALAIPAASQSTDLGMTTRIMDEGFNRSQVMLTAEYLADQIGPRLTNSPAMRKAEGWTSGKFTEWGLSNVHKEGFEFGRGWSIESSSVRMVSPRPIQLTAIPIAWTPGTNGPITADAMFAPIHSKEDFAKYKGKLKGKIVLIFDPAILTLHTTADATKSPTDEEILERAASNRPRGGPPATPGSPAANAAKTRL